MNQALQSPGGSVREELCYCLARSVAQIEDRILTFLWSSLIQTCHIFLFIFISRGISKKKKLKGCNTTQGHNEKIRDYLHRDRNSGGLLWTTNAKRWMLQNVYFCARGLSFSYGWESSFQCLLGAHTLTYETVICPGGDFTSHRTPKALEFARLFPAELPRDYLTQRPN